jgi:hypothetical protein
MDVDEARRHHHAFGVDLLAPGTGNSSDGGDSAVQHGDVGLARLATRAIDDRSTTYHQVESISHGNSPGTNSGAAGKKLPPTHKSRKRAIESALKR